MPDSSVGIGRSGDRIPVGGEIFRTRQDSPWGPPSLVHSGYRFSFSGVKRPTHLAPKLTKEYIYISIRTTPLGI
jgi:hypothetical protein